MRIEQYFLYGLLLPPLLPFTPLRCREGVLGLLVRLLLLPLPPTKSAVAIGDHHWRMLPPPLPFVNNLISPSALLLRLLRRLNEEQIHYSPLPPPPPLPEP